jgi:hypothetical protein
MKILQDISISLTPEYVLEEQCRRRGGAVRPWMVEIAKEALEVGQALFAPAAIYDEFTVRGVAGGQVYLAISDADDPALARLVVGPKADLVAPAERVMVSVLTIGPSLERRVHELQAAGENLLAYMLDAVGVLALGVVGESLRCMAEERAAELGWGVSPALSPGSLVGWSLSGQRELVALLPIQKIGVQLSDYCVLMPHKSASVLVGLGPGYESNHVGSVCRYCALAGSCWRRRGGET